MRVDCGGYRAQQEDRVAEKALKLADKVRESGRELWMNAMNSYYRRLVHNALACRLIAWHHWFCEEDRRKI